MVIYYLFIDYGISGSDIQHLTLDFIKDNSDLI